MPDFAPDVVRAGAAKPDPFTILVVANPALEAPWKSNTFVADPIMANRAGFDACVRYIEQSLFGSLPAQTEPMLADPALSPHVRMLSLFPVGLEATSSNSFVAQDGVSSILVARRVQIRDFLVREAIVADIVYAISASGSHTRASAWFTSDDDTRRGFPFTVDGAAHSHRCYYDIPGTIGMHYTATSLTAAHEFQHAVSSYSNGQVVDLYVDSPPALNNKWRRPPVPPVFGTYNVPRHNSDPNRGPLGYPPSWNSFHCEIHDVTNPALMDNYHLAPGGVSTVCQNDTITRLFIKDRVLAKINR